MHQSCCTATFAIAQDNGSRHNLPMDSKLIVEAITLRRCIATTYNRMHMKLAPHVLYTRHGDLFLDAVAVERDGKAPDQPKLGTFKVAGLQAGELTANSFFPLPGFDAGDPKYHETTPFAVEGD